MKTIDHVDVVLPCCASDRDRVEPIARWLEDKAGLTVWFEPWCLSAGENRVDTIKNVILGARACVIFAGAEGVDRHLLAALAPCLENLIEQGQLRLVPVSLPGGRRTPKDEWPPLLRRLSWLDLPLEWESDESIDLTLEELGIAKAFQNQQPRYSGSCPFRGLQVFREQDSQFFFGRDRLIPELRQHLKEHNFLAVLGPSGGGKSSLVQAGLIPAERERGALVSLFTPRERPLEELAFALRAHQGTTGRYQPVEHLLERLNRNECGLHYMVRELLEESGHECLLLVVDQFEELFTQTRDKSQRRVFLENLYQVVKLGTARVVLTMRSDFLGKCAQFPRLNTLLNGHMVQISPLGGEDLRAALERPAKMVGLVFEDGLVDRMIADVEGASGQMPLLGFALLELYHRRDENLLTFSSYQEIGGIRGALARRARVEFERLNPKQRDLLSKMFVLRLVQPGEGTVDTRRRAAKEELLALNGNGGEAEVLVEAWTRARLLTITRDEARGQDWVEVAHEAMIHAWEQIQCWMGEHRESARLADKLRKATREWRSSGRHGDYLLQGAPLLRVEEWFKSANGDLTLDEKAFVRASIKKREKGKIRRYFLTAAMAVLAAMALISAFHSNRERGKAERESQIRKEIESFMVGFFQANDPNERGGKTLSVKDMLDQAADKVRNGLKQQPEIQVRLMDTLGMVHMNSGYYEDARTFLEEALQKSQNLYGPEHPAVGISRLHLGQVLNEMGKSAEAEAHIFESEKILREQPEEWADVQSEMAVLYHNRLDLTRAKIHYRTAIDTRKRLLKSRDSQDLHLKNSNDQGGLANIMFQENDFENAIDTLEGVLDIQRKILGPSHLDVATTIHSLASVYLRIDDLDVAESLFQQSLDIRIRILGTEHSAVAHSLVNLAKIHELRDDLDNAVTTLERATAILAGSVGRKHVNYGKSVYNLAALFHMRGELEKSADLYREALENWLNFFGPDHLYIAFAYINFASLKKDQNDYLLAERLLCQAEDIYSRYYEEGDWQLADVRGQRAGCLAELGFLAEAEPLLLESYAYFKANQEDFPRYFELAHERLQNLYQRWDKPDLASRYLVTASPREI